MAERTEIAWCDSTFNPWIGCTKVGPGCDHCYAERDMDRRRHRVRWGAGQARSRTSADYWKQPLRWNRALFCECRFCGWRGEYREPRGDEVAFACPGCSRAVGWAVPARRRVFCASLADVFDNEVDPQWRADLFALIRATPNLDWLLLTKRIGNAERMIGEAGGWDGGGIGGPQRVPLPNVWLGATVVNQAEADRDIHRLLATPAAVHFLSIEPMLGPVNLRLLHNAPLWAGDGPSAPCRANDRVGLSWVVAGGESGPGARPMHPAWARSLRDQCAAAGVPFLFKQWGEWSEPGFSFPDGRPDLAEPDDNARYRVGKKAAGRTLDGVVHNEFPRTA